MIPSKIQASHLKYNNVLRLSLILKVNINIDIVLNSISLKVVATKWKIKGFLFKTLIYHFLVLRKCLQRIFPDTLNITNAISQIILV